MSAQLLFLKSVCDSFKKVERETAFLQNDKEKRSKKSHHLKNIFLKTMHIFSQF